MAAGKTVAKGTAKTALKGSKNDPGKRRKVSAFKLFMGKNVKPVLYMDRQNKRKYIAAMYEDESLAQDASGVPVNWKNI